MSRISMLSNSADVKILSTSSKFPSRDASINEQDIFSKFQVEGSVMYRISGNSGPNKLRLHGNLSPPAVLAARRLFTSWHVMKS